MKFFISSLLLSLPGVVVFVLGLLSSIVTIKFLTHLSACNDVWAIFMAIAMFLLPLILLGSSYLWMLSPWKSRG